MFDLVIRQFQEEDLQEIKCVLRATFDRPGKNQEFNEWESADKVRTDPGYVPELCLVATITANSALRGPKN